MSTSPFTQPDNTSQEPATYKSNIDDAFKVLARIAGIFNCQAQDTADMTVKVLAGAIFTGGASITEVAAQNTSTITAPSSNPRIDRVVIDADDGTVSVITGSEAASPSAPSITSGKLPVAQIYLTASHTEIVNDDITDERQLSLLGLGTMAQQSNNSVDINGGAIDGVTIGANSAVTEAQIDNLNIDGNSITSSSGNITLSPNTNVSISGSVSNNIGVNFSMTLDNAGAAFCHYNSGTFSSNVTSAFIYYSLPRLEDSSWTLPALNHFYVSDVVENSADVTEQNGFRVASSFITGTNNYAFRGDIPDGSGRYNAYMAGTAPNYFEGEIQSAKGQVAYAQGYFDGTATTPSFAYDYNFGAITDNGTGDYTCAFTTALSSTSYTVLALTGTEDRDNPQLTSRATTGFRIKNHRSGINNADPSYMSVVVFADY